MLVNTLRILIWDDDLQNLKKNGYRLCITKTVSNCYYNIVWQAYEDYLSNNVFSWVSQYQLFGTNFIEQAEYIGTQTNTVDIELGQTSVLDVYGILQKPATDGPVNSLTLQNYYGNIYPVLCQFSFGIDGASSFSPTQVMSNACILGSKISITPENSVKVWFQQSVETSSIIRIVNGPSIEVSYNWGELHTILFSEGSWKTIKNA